jgi:hypothetical protein
VTFGKIEHTATALRNAVASAASCRVRQTGPRVQRPLTTAARLAEQRGLEILLRTADGDLPSLKTATLSQAAQGADVAA